MQSKRIHIYNRRGKQNVKYRKYIYINWRVRIFSLNQIYEVWVKRWEDYEMKGLSFLDWKRNENEQRDRWNEPMKWKKNEWPSDIWPWKAWKPNANLDRQTELGPGQDQLQQDAQTDDKMDRRERTMTHWNCLTKSIYIYQLDIGKK